MENKEILWVFLHLSKTGGTTFNNHLAKEMKLDEEFIHPQLIKDEKGEYNPPQERDKKEKERIRVISSHGAYYGIHKEFPQKETRYLIFVRDPAERLVSLYNFRVKETPPEKRPSFLEWYNSRRKNELCKYINMFYKKSSLPEPAKKKIPKKFRKWFFKNRKRKILLRHLMSLLGYYKKSLPSEKEKEVFENAKKLLDSCWFIGITKELDKDLPILFEKISVNPKYKNQRVTGKAETWKHDWKKGKNNPESFFKLDNKTRQKIYKENPFDVKLYEYAKKLNQEKRRNLKK